MERATKTGPQRHRGGSLYAPRPRTPNRPVCAIGAASPDGTPLGTTAQQPLAGYGATQRVLLERLLLSRRESRRLGSQQLASERPSTRRAHSSRPYYHAGKRLHVGTIACDECGLEGEVPCVLAARNFRPRRGSCAGGPNGGAVAVRHDWHGCGGHDVRERFSSRAAVEARPEGQTGPSSFDRLRTNGVGPV